LKYRQHGYQDDDQGDRERPERQDRPERPRRDPDLPGGRLSEPQRIIKNLRCHHCGQSVPLELDARGEILAVTRDMGCGNCQAAVHACRNCKSFDPQSPMECRKPVKVRYRKHEANDCELFEPKVTVEMTRDASRSEGSFAHAPASAGSSPRTQTDARKAFESLFKS
jgi:hypothetical protein